MKLMIRPLHLSAKQVKNKAGQQNQNGLCRTGKEDRQYKVVLKVRLLIAICSSVFSEV